MERATATRPKSQLAANDLFSQFFEVDRELVQWFTSVARREVETGSVPTKKEMEWIKLIHRFYHSYVPYLQAHYAETRLPETCRVYIAHCGMDKKVYAERIKSILDDERIPGVFLDNRMPPGGNPHDQMLSRAVTTMVCWFVASKNMVKSEEWPIRELLISYVRHNLEKPEHFCLLMDLLETETDACGTWRHQFLSLSSLHVYNQCGLRKPSPANMQQTVNNELLDDRIRRLSATKLLSEKSMLDFASGGRETSTDESPVPTSGVSASIVHRVFPDAFRHRCSKAKHIKIVATWLIPEFLRDELIEALCGGASLSIWLLSPKSAICRYRKKALQQSELYVRQDLVITGIETTLKLIKDIENEARHNSPTTTKSVDIRYWDTLPSVPIVQADEWFVHGYYFHQRTINPGPWVEVPPGDFYAKILQKEMTTMEALSSPGRHCTAPVWHAAFPGRLCKGKSRFKFFVAIFLVFTFSVFLKIVNLI